MMTTVSGDKTAADHPRVLTVHGNGIRFVAQAMGQGPLVLCLHGFPDSAHSFDELLPVLADAGYRAVAPFMRGYAPTAAPEDRACDPDTLGRDVLALADALGATTFFVVGHDWGAVAAYAAAAGAPERIRGMVTAAVPPLRLFLRNQNLHQMRRSWYMGFFQLRGLADHQLAANGCALVERLWRAWSPDWNFSDDAIAPVQAILANRDARRAALDYYRALPAALVSPRRRHERRRLLGRLGVRALVVNGSDDGCIGAEMFTGAEACFTRDCRRVALPAGHFMHRECPDQFAGEVLSFLSAERPAGRD